MKKKWFLPIGILLFFAASFFQSGCTTKTGCKINDSVHSKTRKDGSFSSKPGTSSLFPKSGRKR